MTTQIEDTFYFNGDMYMPISPNPEPLFKPSKYGLKPTMACTSCFRGYVCDYRVNGLELMLDELLLYQDDADLSDPSLVLNNVSPKIPDSTCFNLSYKDLSIIIPFTGKLLIGANPIKPAKFMCINNTYEYDKLMLLEFTKGKLAGYQDFSETVKGIRSIIELVQSKDSGNSFGIEIDNLLFDHFIMPNS